MTRSRSCSARHLLVGRTTSVDPEIDSIAKFAHASRRLIGKTVSERSQWNTEATADAIRHFAWGISDDNPLWVDHTYAVSGPYGRLAAPPTFLFAVLYPFLHGEPSNASLTFLINDITCSWYLPILEGDRLIANAVCKDVVEAQDRSGRNTVYIVAETTYQNHENKIVGIIEGTLAAIERQQSELMLDREIHSYTVEDIKAIGGALCNEQRTGRRTSINLTIKVGAELPTLVRGPLTLGDLISWQAAVGPSYRAAALGYRDLLANPHTATVLPQVGWPVRYSQQHEDFTLTSQRGMPAPFDNSTMRAAWLSVLLTNWMGDNGFLRRLHVSTIRPVIYGDTIRYSGKVSRCLRTFNEMLYTIRLTGTNQLEEVTTTGEAEVAICSRAKKMERKTNLYKQRKVIDWGRRSLPANPLTVCDLFAKQAQTKPQSTAVMVGQQKLTYSQLDTETNLLSSALAYNGLRPGARLGLYLGRTIDMVKGIIACVKAGAAYVPLDPTYPRARLDHMIANSEIDFILTDGKQFAINEAKHPPILLLDKLIDRQHHLTSNQPAAIPTAKDPAYLLFTSGSKGQSKAVIVSYASLGLYLRSMLDTLDVESSDVCLHTASFSFSAAIRQFWLPLCAGAKLVVADEEARHNPIKLLEQIRRKQVTVWDTVPSVLEFTINSLQELGEHQYSHLLDNQLRKIFTTGEPLFWETVRAWKKLRSNQASITNLYSQTEAAGTICVYPVLDAGQNQVGIVPLGRPVHNTGICLLDNNLQPVAEGEIGEIYIAGERLSKPDARSDIFIDITLPDGTKETMLRTGDLGCQSANRVIEYVGRADDQIRIRGLRVNLSELEAAFRRIQQVESCVVVGSANSKETANTQIIAYVVPHTGQKPATDDLRAQLARWLPEYMLPQNIILLDKLPRNPNGKLDRSALIQLESQQTKEQTEHLAPRNEIEELLAAVWCRFLNVDVVDVNDNFFELGGHSLLATRIISYLNDETGIEVSLLEFFDRPTIADLAMLLRNNNHRH